jgi:methylmalonyl-CoA/ethylmalonyl-CoA epimerase
LPGNYNSEKWPTMNAISLIWQPEGGFHHVGFVVASIAIAAPGFAGMLQADWDEQVFHDPNQDVRVTFMKSRRSGDPLWELVEPADDRSPVHSFAVKGGGLHHVCYVVDNLEQALTGARSLGAIVTRQPMPAVAFGGRRIAWIYTRNRLLIEYLER